MRFLTNVHGIGLSVLLAACSSTHGTEATGVDAGTDSEVGAGPDASSAAADASPDASSAAADASPDASSAAADASPDAPSDAAGAATLQGHVIYDSYNGQSNIPARGYAIGLVDGTVMTTLDDKGFFALAAPTNVPIALLAQLDGEVSVQRVLVVPPGGAAVDMHVIDIDAYVNAVSQTGAQLADGGVVAVRFEGSTQGGYGASIALAHQSTFVFKGDFTSPLASATTLVAGDTLYFAEVTPGTTTLAITPPAGMPSCTDASAPGTTSYPVAKRTMTEIVLHCAGP